MTDSSVEKQQHLVYDSRQIGRSFLDLARSEGKSLTVLQLIKLTYLAHGWLLGLYGRPLLEDDVEAWPLGPVLRRLYNSVRHYGKDLVVSIDHEGSPDLDKDARSIVEQVFKVYGDKPGTFLSALTHEKGTPWYETWERYGKHAVIPQDLIQEHFAEKANKNVA